jgi:hypothetical protein
VLSITLAVALFGAVVIAGRRTHEPGAWRAVFVVLVAIVDVWALFEVCGPAGPRTAPGALLFSGVLMLTLPGFVLWWRAMDRTAIRRRVGEVGSVVDFLLLRDGFDEGLEPDQGGFVCGIDEMSEEPQAAPWRPLTKPDSNRH